MTRARVLSPAALLAGVALTLVLTGCGGPAGGGSGGSGGSASDTPSASDTATPSETPSDGSADGGGPGIPAACTRDDLDITYTATDNTAGHAHGILTMTNSSTQPCGMAGYPILYMGSSEVEAPVGQPASPDGPAGSGFVIAPGQAATSAVTMTRAGIIEGCSVVTTTHLVAAPPQDDPFDWTASGRHVPIDPTDSCNESSIGLLTVGALQPA